MKRKLITIISSCLVGVALVGCNQTPTTNNINEDRIDVAESVDGLEFSSTEIQHIFNLTKNDLKDRFGNATKVFETKITATNGHEVDSYDFSNSGVVAGIGDNGKVKVLTVTDNSIEHIRGIKIGDSVETVISKFKNNFNSDLSTLEKISEWEGEYYLELYGDVTMDDISNETFQQKVGYIFHSDAREGYFEINLKDNNEAGVAISIRDGAVSSISYLCCTIF